MPGQQSADRAREVRERVPVQNSVVVDVKR